MGNNGSRSESQAPELEGSKVRRTDRALEWWSPSGQFGEEAMCFRTEPMSVAREPSVEYGGKLEPAIHLKGIWLKELGWPPGTPLIIDADRDSIRIYRSDGVEDPPGYESK